MKTYKATLVRIEHRIIKATVNAESQEEAESLFDEMLEGVETGPDGYVECLEWGTAECVHSEEFVQDLVEGK